MLRKYPHVAARIFNTPLLVYPGKLDAIIAGLGTRFGLSAEQLPAPAAYDSLPGEKRKPGYRVHGNVAVLDVFGVLTHRGEIDADSTYLLGYRDIAQRLDAAVRDRGVNGVVLNIDSPGGEVNGAFQLAEQIRRASAVKPVRAVVDGLGASAAYLLASAASDITVTSTGMVGSVGVVMRHVDFSRALAADGIGVTQIYAGAHKVDGNPFEPLSEAVRAQFQAEVDALYAQFTAAVANYRRIEEPAVRGTEARVYLASEAVAKKLADRIGTVDQVVAEMVSATGGRARTALISTQQEKTMSDQKLFTQAELDASVAEVTAKAETATAARVTAAREEGRTEGREAERKRVSTILALPEAQGRTALALKAVSTGLSAEQAGELLGASPKSTGPSLAAAGNVRIGPDNADNGDTDDRQAGHRAAAYLRGAPAA